MSKIKKGFLGMDEFRKTQENTEQAAEQRFSNDLNTLNKKHSYHPGVVIKNAKE